MNPRPLGYEPYDVYLWRPEQSPITALTSPDQRRKVLGGLLRLPRCSLSRCIRFTNRFTGAVLDQQVSAVLARANAHPPATRFIPSRSVHRTVSVAGPVLTGRVEVPTFRFFRPDISRVGRDRASVLRCRQSLPRSSGLDSEWRIAGVRAGRILSRCSLRWCPGARSCPGCCR